jgi:phosphatidylglycerophosphatase A
MLKTLKSSNSVTLFAFLVFFFFFFRKKNVKKKKKIHKPHAHGHTHIGRDEVLGFMVTQNCMDFFGPMAHN